MVPLIGFSKLHLILALPNILAHYNITISYYVQVNSLWLKSNVVSKWASKKLWGVTIYFAVDGTLCSAIRYQEKKIYNYSLIWTLCIWNIGKITCKNVQKSFILFVLLHHSIFINKIFSLWICSSCICSTFMHCQ